MIRSLGKLRVLISSFVLMTIMFIIVMFFVNQSIDGGDGSGVLKLQLSFDKTVGISIIDNWGNSGVEYFKRWIFTDYIYALTYSFFFASFLSFLIVRKINKIDSKHKTPVYLAFFSGLCDWFENTIEIFFIKDPYGFSTNLFFIHSIVSVVKWLVIIIIITYIIVLLTIKREYNFGNKRGDR